MRVNPILVLTIAFILSPSNVLSSMNNQYVVAKQNTTRFYQWCSQAYEEWPCEQRSTCVLPYLSSCCIPLISREVATIGISLKKNNHCDDIHKLAWCTKDAWLPCHCNSAEDVCCSIGGNCSTVVTIASMLIACCIYTPCFNDKGCRLRKKNSIRTIEHMGYRDL